MLLHPHMTLQLLLHPLTTALNPSAVCVQLHALDPPHAAAIAKSHNCSHLLHSNMLLQASVMYGCGVLQAHCQQKQHTTTTTTTLRCKQLHGHLSLPASFGFDFAAIPFLSNILKSLDLSEACLAISLPAVAAPKIAIIWPDSAALDMTAAVSWPETMTCSALVCTCCSWRMLLALAMCCAASTPRSSWREVDASATWHSSTPAE
jgi:hypothetical protein